MTAGDPAEPGRVAGIVLAAGLSTRMPARSKLLLRFGRTTVIQTVVDKALQAGLEPVAVVVGHEGDSVASLLGNRPVRIVRNLRYRSGRCTSLAAGIRAIEALPEVEAGVVLLGDEPGVDEAVIRRVVTRWRDTRVPLVRTRYRDRPGHPVLLDRAAFAAARSLAGDAIAWTALRERGTAGVEVAVEGPAPVDVDDPERLREAGGGGED